MPGTAAERLRRAAREKWGDRWTLEIQEYTDGDREETVYHYRGRADEDGERLLERDRLLVVDGELVHDRERVRKEKCVSLDVIERGVEC